jgi:pimeloyl-ACP methyl ester carboxylesterase
MMRVGDRPDAILLRMRLSRMSGKVCAMRLLSIFGLLLLASCAFVKNAAIQSDYERIQATDPSLLNLKHMMGRKTFFVYGQLTALAGDPPLRGLAVAAYSNRFHRHELVDVMHQLTTGVHFGLNLPPANYDLVVFSDSNGNGVYEADEAIGVQALELLDAQPSQMVIGGMDIAVGTDHTVGWPVALDVQRADQPVQSLFYPPNTIRTLDDALFDPAMASLGMYQPAAFLERANTMFFALEEDVSYKIPVIFVHGIDGSARDFSAIVDRLDRTRFKPWFFHYPSGGDLDQMAELFSNLFLSGRVIPIDDKVPTIIVAHSMGGLVVQEALNRINGDAKNAITFISIASPFGGMPAAEAGSRNGLLVLPSWRDLSPASGFIKNLFRQTLPPSVAHRLVYAFGNPDLVKTGENSDGTVPLSSQLPEEAQRQAAEQKGFNASHVGVLKDTVAVDYLIDQITRVQTRYPEKHMAYFRQGGFEQTLSDRYSKLEAYALRYYGKYIRALVQRQIEPLNDYQRHLLDAATAQKEPATDPESAWLKFVAEYPYILEPGQP